ncbi:methionine biosynthesis protein MetW [Polynucleobacter sphagniphilus]|jgi:methionine biosynthesis protein MetW|uniref:Methionine biosynthesis protein MetW n=1 Tax=Polynucleobacter sphagniphilus TaxID=1743169 RepID=A0AA43M7X0_9BURK|nr:methionine biosynthesis protein MetW [Polynucleobacter sphagniphilus]MDF9788474.1 methionine biosynthesis protein MetW [Polynucleobacter sphagniphilus]MDH6155053.1 methionine biosynthesis protein MetW [Polynucleobacter sphagniphilus]MDH6241642.1 methionine biosynthesis protein MetW [Polynucleobacter sphagniphilus]MDH6248926.1 methionine biosynthesis protein MetW [Polynucleobacter sphagniphilus]MDH6299566.1 methionine biosynthesis protein MetW [Polynucleobacter sphagniphilus]
MKRADFSAIANWISPNSQVLDLGCGDGSFLEYLQTQKTVQAYGVEIDDARVLACVQKGLNVIQQNLEGGLALFGDASFDTVVLSQTLQTIHQTEKILREVVRVGKESIISFPNFGHWSHRLAVGLGHMPVSKSLPYQWYNTPNVRVLTVADFENLASNLGLKIIDQCILHEGRVVTLMPNLFGSLALFRIRRA